MNKTGCLFVAAAALFAVACGPSPAARGPVQMVKVPADRVVDCDCDADDDDDDEVVVAQKPVEYIPIETWTPPPQVQRVEALVPPGTASGGPTAMPALTLHRPIPATVFYGRYGRIYR